MFNAGRFFIILELCRFVHHTGGGFMGLIANSFHVKSHCWMKGFIIIMFENIIIITLIINILKNEI